MGTITVNINNAIEQEFRNVVKQKIGEGKGTLGKALSEAMKNWVEAQQQKQIVEEMTLLLRKGFDLGKVKYKREELYDRVSRYTKR